MSDYAKVTEALQSGTSPASLCATCPWDRFCITPPSMTKEQVDRQMQEAQAIGEKQTTDAQASGKDPGAGPLVGLLFSTILTAGKDTQAQVCPVLVVRMRSSEGRKFADSVRQQMKGWDDELVDTTT